MGSNGSFVTVHPKEAIGALLPNDDNLEDFEQVVTIYSEQEGEELVAPVEAYDVLGEIQLVRKGVVYGSSQLVASSTIELSYSEYIGNKIVNTLKNPLVILFIIVVLALIGGYIFLVIRYRRSKKEYLEAQKRRIKNARMRDERQTGRSGLDSGIRPRILRDQDDYVGRETKETHNRGERDYFEEFFGKK